MTEMGTLNPKGLENHIFMMCMDSLNEVSSDQLMLKKILIRLVEAWD